MSITEYQTPFNLADISAECAILSGAASKKEWLEEFINAARLEDFTRAETRAAFVVMTKLYEEQKPVDGLTLISTHRKALNDAGFKRGGDLTMVQVLMSPPMMHEFKPFFARLKEAAARRAVYHAAEKAMRMIQTGETAAAGYEELQRAILDRDSFGMKRDFLTPEDMQRVIFEAVETRADDAKRKNRVLYTQFFTLNNLTGGFEKGDLIILSAESGAGKSAFSMNLAYGTAFMNRRATLYLNSEMTDEQMGLRWGAFLTKVSHSALRNGTATAEQMGEIVNALDCVGKSKLYTLNIPDMQIQSVIAEVRRMKARYGIEIAIVDYIGRMDTLNSKDVAEWQVMKSAAQRLKTLAHELEITVIMVAQLREDGKALAQASYMKHEADLWINLSRMRDDKEKTCWPWNCVLDFRKARNVESGKSVMMRFDGDTLTFTDRRKDAERMAGSAPMAGMTGGQWQKGGVPA